MSNTNYTTSKSVASTALNNSDLSDDVAGQIIKSLGRFVKFNNFGDIQNPGDSAHQLVSSDLKGKDIVYSLESGVINLNIDKARDVSGLDAIIFNSTPNQPGVDLTMTGKGADAFKGWIVTYGTDDTINLTGNGVKVGSGDGNDSVTTGNGRDNIISADGNDTVNTGKGNDTISSGNGDDIIDSGDGNDSVNAGNGNDSVNTGNGNDNVNSGNGNDSVNTGKGNDTVNTGTGNDSVDTGAGSDLVYVGQGNVVVNAGDNNDIIKLLHEFTGSANLDGGTGRNTLNLSNVSIHDVSSSGQTVTITLADNSVITANNFQKFIYDNNGSENGGIKTVGIIDLDGHDFIV